MVHELLAAFLSTSSARGVAAAVGAQTPAPQTQLVVLPPLDPASRTLLSGALIPRVEPRQTEGAPAPQPLTHLVIGSAETKAPRHTHADTHTETTTTKKKKTHPQLT